MIRTLRFIGGSKSGQNVKVTDSDNSVYVRVPVPQPLTGFSPKYDPFGLPRMREEQYRRTAIQITSPNFTYAETCLVLEGMSRNDVEKEIRRLGVPAAPQPNLQRIPVTLSVVSHVSYDPELRVMEVGLPAGVYRYEEVPQSLVADFIFAKSKGAFFNERVKGKYASYKV